jgi:hypothetical protein
VVLRPAAGRSTRPRCRAASRGKPSSVPSWRATPPTATAPPISRFFWGFRLYLVCSPDGMPHGFCLAPANELERDVAAVLLERMRPDGSLHGDELLIGDKGFAGKELEQIAGLLHRRPAAPRPTQRTAALRLARRHPAMDRVDHRNHQRPALALTPQRPHTRRRLAQLADRQPGRSFTLGRVRSHAEAGPRSRRANEHPRRRAKKEGAREGTMSSPAL